MSRGRRYMDDAYTESLVQSTQGIFSGAGGHALAHRDRVSEKVKRGGVDLMFECDGCGNPKTVHVEWPELVALKHGLDPAQALRPEVVASVLRQERYYVQGDLLPFRFDKDDQSWRPMARCDCGFHFQLRVSPTDPEKWLVRGRQSGYINPAVEKEINTVCATLRGRHQQRRR